MRTKPQYVVPHHLHPSTLSPSPVLGAGFALPPPPTLAFAADIASFTPLMRCCEHSQLEAGKYIIAALVRTGLSLDEQDRWGHTAADEAHSHQTLLAEATLPSHDPAKSKPRLSISESKHPEASS